MSMKQRIENKLSAALPLQHLEVVNESHMHSVPPGSETHFKVVAVSPEFAGKRLVARHQRIYGILAEEMKSGVHALAIHPYTPEEWEAIQGQAPESPSCMGGSKHDPARRGA